MLEFLHEDLPPQHPVEDFSTSPSSVGSLLSQSMALIEEPNLTGSTCQDTDNDLVIVQPPLESYCLNCEILEEKNEGIGKQAREPQ